MKVDGSMPVVSWKQVAVQKQERLATGATGVPVKEMVVAVQTSVYEAKNGSVEIKSVDNVRRVNITV